MLDRHDLIVALATAGAQRRPELARRIWRAVDLIQAGGIVRQDDGTWLVPSQSRPSETYCVNGSCTCPDATFVEATTAAPHGLCKHRLAVRLLARAEELARRPTIQRCPMCSAVIEGRQYYVGGRGYIYFDVCSGDGSHFAKVAEQ